MALLRTGRQSYSGDVLKAVFSVAVLASLVDAQSTTTKHTFSLNTTITTAATPSSTTATSSTVAPTPVVVPKVTFQVAIEFKDIAWKKELLNRSSPLRIALAENVTQTIENFFKAKNVSASVQVIELKPGSVLAFLKVSTNKTENDAKEMLQNQMKSGMIGSLQVSKSLFSGSLFDVVLKLKAKCNDSKELKGFKQSRNLTLEIEKLLPGNETATVEKIACLETEDVTIVTVRVQVENSTAKNPNEQLRDLKRKVDDGRLGNFTMIPEWQAYIPGEKLFSVSFNLKFTNGTSETVEVLQKAIIDLFQNESDFSYVTVELKNNQTVIVKVGMKTAAPDQPYEALAPLKQSVTDGQVGNVTLIGNSFRAYINPNTITQKVFEVHFRLNVSDCDKSIISQNGEAKKAVEGYVNTLTGNEYFIDSKLINISCVNGHYYPNDRFVYGVFLVYITPDAPENFLHRLHNCEYIWDWGVKFVTLTPTSPEIPVGNSTHLSCSRRTTPTTPTTPSPTTPTTPSSTRPKEETTKKVTSSGTPPIVQNPCLYVKMKLAITWGEFCSKLEHGLKQKIAWNLYDKDGTRVSPDRIIFINVKKSCAELSKKTERAEVWFYVSKVGSNKLHKCLTLKAYRVLTMFVENANTKELGPEFEEKVIHVDLAGNDASNHSLGFSSGKLSTWSITLIAIAGAVGLLLLTLACCCVFCCGAKRRKKGKAVDKAQKMNAILVDANDAEGRSGKDKKGTKIKGRSDTDENANKNEDKEKKDKNFDEGEKGKVVSYENQAYGFSKDDGRERSSISHLAPAIVTSHVPDTDKADEESNTNKGGQVSDNASSGSGCSRRGSASTGGEGQGSGSKQSSPLALRHIDADLKDRGRRRSSAHSIIDDEDVPLTHKTGTVGIVALALRNRNEKKKEAEFKNLSKDVPEEEIKYPTNTQSKNRSPDVLPAPRTRVKLSSNPDYINANWIRDHKGQQRYIATQHPLYETAEDFWRMVWERESRLVVMVNEEEKEKPTEFMNYLPRGEGNTKSFGGIEVTIKQIVKKADYTMTILNVADSKKASSPREVSHMKFTSWKERAMPNVALFVGFVTATREARKKYGDIKAPTIVHCSDGLGFTGVYIAVDIGVKSHEESKTSVVDVFELSKNLRRDRHGIVCSLEHYNFIYQALYEYTVNYDESAEAQRL